MIRVLTPGTATTASLIEPKENNFLAAVARQTRAAAAVGAPGNRTSRSFEPVIGLAFVDLSTGEFRATEFSGEAAEARLRDELGILAASWRILLPRPVTLFPTTSSVEMDGIGAVETRLDDWVLRTTTPAKCSGSIFAWCVGLRGVWIVGASTGYRRGRSSRALLA